ncbi:hypothetical protein NMY3_02899 [Candidatus Nitrosocosmicus oleophilus]|uniref:Uncharacterized protein n=1 Tax=Candidatus Nitrosocosmicus oleophilus TaxID=1353260 RepID=A0A654M040_9ARCH|nr:hypothetical protein NMY3_02899 [Candidatus Nitrosocosmicus oleophilus]
MGSRNPKFDIIWIGGIVRNTQEQQYKHASYFIIYEIISIG